MVGDRSGKATFLLAEGCEALPRLTLRSSSRQPKADPFLYWRRDGPLHPFRHGESVTPARRLSPLFSFSFFFRRGVRHLDMGRKGSCLFLFSPYSTTSFAILFAVAIFFNQPPLPWRITPLPCPCLPPPNGSCLHRRHPRRGHSRNPVNGESWYIRTRKIVPVRDFTQEAPRGSGMGTAETNLLIIFQSDTTKQHRPKDTLPHLPQKHEALPCHNCFAPVHSAQLCH